MQDEAIEFGACRLRSQHATPKVHLSLGASFQSGYLQLHFLYSVAVKSNERLNECQHGMCELRYSSLSVKRTYFHPL